MYEHPMKVPGIGISIFLLTCSCCAGPISTHQTTPSAAIDAPNLLLALPDRPFQILSLLQTDARGSSSRADLIASLAAGASRQGADAVCLISVQERYRPGNALNELWLSGYRPEAGLNQPRAYAFSLKYIKADSRAPRLGLETTQSDHVSLFHHGEPQPSVKVK